MPGIMLCTCGISGICGFVAVFKEPAQRAKPNAAAEPAAAKPDDGAGRPGADGERGPDAPGEEASMEGGAPPAAREKPKAKAGMAAGTNFAGRSPPGTAPWSTRFAEVKSMWIESLAWIQHATNAAVHAILDRKGLNLELRHIHPQIKPGCYQKSQVGGRDVCQHFYLHPLP